VQFALTDEQKALQDTVRDYLADRFGPAQVREVFEDPEGPGDPETLWQACGEQGWLAVTVPEEHDGLGLGLLDAAVLVRAWGAGTVPGPFPGTLLGGEAIRLAGSAAQAAEHLPRLGAGELRLAPALRRAGGAWAPEGVGVRVEGDRLSGGAAQVDYAHTADLLVVAALDGAGEASLWLVDPAAEGVTVERTPVLDRTTRQADVTLDGATGERLENGSSAVLVELLDRGAVLAAADLSGIARHALDETVAYDKDRVQFGRPVGSFQAIKHHLADLHVAVTMAEHAALYAAHALDERRDDARLMVSVAKAKCSDAARDATAAMIQYHGGIGYTWEHDAHFSFKRAKRLEYAFGDAVAHRERIARLVVDEVPVAV
jgi:alkylation response protein AidB-like acyl-CoA dehydrogenase